MDRRGINNSGIIGEFANDTFALNYIRAQHLDTNLDGTGNPWDGMTYYNATFNLPKEYMNGAWRFLEERGVNKYYVGKHGANTNDGLSDNNAFLTFTFAIAAAVAAGPGAANRFLIVCLDGGIYTENLTLPSYVSVFAPDAVLVGNHIVNDDSGINAKTFRATAGNAVSKTAGAGNAQIVAGNFELTGAAIGLLCTSGNMCFDICAVTVENGAGIGSLSTDELHGFVDVIHITGNGIGAGIIGVGTMTIDVNNIYDDGAGIGLYASGGANLKANVRKIDCNVAYNVLAASGLKMFVNELTGTETIAATATVCVVKACESKLSQTFRPEFDWLMFNGAVNDTLNGGKITTTKLPKTATDPGVQFKVDNRFYITGKDMFIQVLCGHSTIFQNLDIDLNYVRTGVGLNLNTQPGAAPLNETPATPGVAYNGFVITFTVPGADVVQGGGIEFQLSRDTSGADTGDLHIWEIRAYQTP